MSAEEAPSSEPWDWGFIWPGEHSPRPHPSPTGSFWGDIKAKFGLNNPILHRPVPAPRPTTGRNEPCPCGSGRKFKVCCLRLK